MADYWEDSSKKKKEKISKKTKGFLGSLRDENFRENLRSFINYLIAALLPLLYFGIFDQLTWDAIFTIKIGGLSLVSIVSSRIIFIEISKRARFDEYKENEDIKKAKEKNKELKKKANKNVDAAIEFNKKDNKKRQEDRNKLAKEQKLSEIRQKINENKIAGKNIESLEKKLERVQKNGVIDNSFKPINLKKLLFKSDSKSSSIVLDESDMYYNVVTDGLIITTLISFLKYFGLGVFGSIPFLLDEPVKNIIIYYAGLFALMIGTTIVRYSQVREKVATKKYGTIENQNSYLKNMIDFIDKYQIEQHKQDTVKYPLK